MKRIFPLAAATLSLVALPALAVPMKTSVPARPNAPTVAPAAAATTATSDRYRPTRFLGVEEARTVGSGDVVMGLGNLGVTGLANNIGASWGVMNGLEFGLNANLNYFRGVNYGPTDLVTNNLSLPVGLFAKGVLVDTAPMSIALGAAVGAAYTSNSVTGTAPSNQFSLGSNLFLPVSFWNAGPGDLHVVPMVTLPITAANASFGSQNWNLALGYSLPIMGSWRLLLADTYRFDNLNTLSLGNRIGLTDNVTVDVGGLSYTTRNTGNNLMVNLFNMNVFFGAPSADFTRAWGL